MTDSQFDGVSRREFLARAAAGGAGALLSLAGPVIEKAYGAGPCSGHLSDIEHFVFLMQENRSFDHYFGTLSGTNGFNTASPLFQQAGWNPKTQTLDPSGVTLPYRFDTTRGPLLNGECVNDPNHDWGPMHTSWNNGAMNNWLPSQASSLPAANVAAIMGYYTRQDIPVHYLLADTFTICDNYHCSVLGPTIPNRLYWVSAALGFDGTQGGPQLTTPYIPPIHQFSWTTMAEHLSAAGVSWKLYETKRFGPVVDTVVGYGEIFANFKQAANPASDLARYGLAPKYPADFIADVAAGKLPHVSWLVPGFLASEHPSLPPSSGAVAIVDALRILLSNPAVWEKTALIISYDENGGFFDHVVPPTAPAGTPGEYITVPDINSVPGSAGIRGPIGLGFRVPCLVISPYSRGPLMAHDTFDHTSQLRLLETRFGVPVPNLTPWRRSVTGDMTSTFNFSVPPNSSKPNLDQPFLRALPKLSQCVTSIVPAYLGDGRPYRVPYPQTMPTQETTPVRGIPSGAC
ncbi:phospholipase C [Mycobacterium conspicuum]|uniref:phospholipase C n=1 Tax=Mycobacterium conspicuum TaxID=44010 RepID=A0A1X1SSE0_9MYCO|nr:phospholipase C [Mycobacterium conspicuum]ORV33448.1 phospholipase [Mycobacterium conspicuum]BBZ39501.1 phospholipase C 4 [Mycobacterium conspicuum]